MRKIDLIVWATLVILIIILGVSLSNSYEEIAVLKQENQMLKESSADDRGLIIKYQEQEKMLYEAVNEQGILIEMQEEYIVELNKNRELMETNIKILENKLQGGK